jgi:hypothetical protein
MASSGSGHKLRLLHARSRAGEGFLSMGFRRFSACTKHGSLVTVRGVLDWTM